MLNEIREHLKNGIIPFWEGLKDEEFGGYYGYMDYDLKLDKKFEKGCILNSRILWFFSSVSRIEGFEKEREYADPEGKMSGSGMWRCVLVCDI